MANANEKAVDLPEAGPAALAADTPVAPVAPVDEDAATPQAPATESTGIESLLRWAEQHPKPAPAVGPPASGDLVDLTERRANETAVGDAEARIAP